MHDIAEFVHIIISLSNHQKQDSKAWIQEYKKLSLFFAARLTFEQAKGDEVSCMTEAELATAKLLQSDNRPTNLCSHSSLFSLPSFAGLHRSLDMKPIHSLARGG